MDNVLACRVCLAIDVKMYPLMNLNYLYFFNNIAVEILPNDGKPQHICYECFKILKNCHNFIEKCQRSEELLNKLQIDEYTITKQRIKTIDRKEHKLISNIEKCGPFIEPKCEVEVKIKNEYNEYYYYNAELNYDETRNDVDQITNLNDKTSNNTNHNEGIINETDIITNDDKEKINSYDVFNDSDGIGDDVDEIKNNSSEEDLPLTRFVKKRTVKSKDLENYKLVQSNKKKKEYKKAGPILSFKRGFHETYAEVIHLSKEKQIEEMNQRRNSLNFLNSPYKCFLCFKGFIEKSAFSNHELKHDKCSGEFECDLCHMRYPTIKMRSTHMLTSHTRQYACKHCPHRSHTANQARDHENWHKGHLYECKLCGEKFKKPTSHLTHIRKHHPTDITCVICGDTFIGRHGLLMHRKMSHPGVQKISYKDIDLYCKDCDVQFLTKEAWKRHILTTSKHSNDETCRICKLKLSKKSELKAHYKEHAKEIKISNSKGEEKPLVEITRIPCKLCASTFVSRSKLHVHNNRIHLGLKYNKNIVCELCGKKCTSNATLTYHQRTHTGERPYACTECPKRFPDSHQLRIHNRTHTDERPYACHLCSKTFRQKPALNRHVRVHTGVKPYSCQYCLKTFSQSNSVKLHIKTVHLKLPRKNKDLNDLTLDKTAIENDVTLQSL